MKQIVILFTQQSVDAGFADPAALCDALNIAAGGLAQYDYAFYDQLRHVVGPDAGIFLPNGKRLDLYDAAYHRRWGEAPEQALAVDIFLRKQGVSCIDDEAARKGSMNKLTQYWRMWEHDIPFPKTVYVAPAQLANWLREELTNTFTLPCILKSAEGTRGSDNYLAHTTDEALRIVADNPGVPFLVQEFIPNDGDYRAFVCGDEVVLAIRRVSNGESHKNNTSQGGAATLVGEDELSPEVRALCVRAAKVFGRDIAGVDVVFRSDDPTRYYLFEVNRSPQVEASSFTAEKARAMHTYFMTLTGGAA